MLSYFSHLNAKLLSASQHYDNSGMLAVDLRRIAAETTSRRKDLFVYYPAAFTGFHEKAPDREGQACDLRQRWRGSRRFHAHYLRWFDSISSHANNRDPDYP